MLKYLSTDRAMTQYLLTAADLLGLDILQKVREKNSPTKLLKCLCCPRKAKLESPLVWCGFNPLHCHSHFT